MNGIYDNGTHMLELVKELVWFDNYDIVSINYDNGMGISIEKWKDSDRLESE